VTSTSAPSAVGSPAPVKSFFSNYKGLPIWRIGACLLALAIVIFSYLLDSMSFALFFSPLFLGCLVVASGWEKSIKLIHGWKTTFEARLQRATVRQGKFAKYISRPFWAGSRGIWNQTERIHRDDVRAAVRLAAAIYYFGFMILALVLFGYAALMIIIVIAMIVFSLWALGKYLGWDSPNGDSSSSPLYPVTSSRVEGLTGTRIEHYDEQRRKIGESLEREGILENYIEHIDRDGQKVGESHTREGMLEDYIERTDSDGKKIGETREREGLLDDYSEHTDKHGNKIGESRIREGLLDTYIEHDFSNARRFCTSCGARLAAGATFCTSCGQRCR